MGHVFHPGGIGDLFDGKSVLCQHTHDEVEPFPVAVNFGVDAEAGGETAAGMCRSAAELMGEF